MTRRKSPSNTDDVSQFEANLTAFIRGFGLLQADETPCGQPLPASHAHALTALDTTPGLSQQDLASTLGLARATISELVTILVDRGWAQRTRDHNDGRVQRLQLTDTGHDMAASITTSRHALLHRVLHELDLADRTTAIHIIGRLVDAAARARTTTTDTTQQAS